MSLSKTHCKVIHIVLGSVLAITACGGGDGDPDTMDAMRRDTMADHQHGPMDMPGTEGMQVDRALMQRHAQEADSMASVMRAHLDNMRRLTSAERYERMGEHVMQVSRMLSMMSRQMREMDMGMGMSDEQMGQMMGMSGDEHRRMMEEMSGMRAELERLQTAPRAEVSSRMPAHLDRVERIVAMLERSAEHMRSR